MNFLVPVGDLIALPPFVRAYQEKNLKIKPYYLLETDKNLNQLTFYGLETQSVPALVTDETPYLQIPDQLQERLNKLASDITKGAKSNTEKAELIRNYFQRDFTYSLKVSFNKKIDPIEDFIFNKKTGFCTHFASAMVLMLRSIGVSANIVSGYLVDEFDRFTDSYIVREKDAHAWAEVYDPVSKAWIGFEPTPVTQMQEYLNFKPGFVDKLTLYLRTFFNKIRKFTHNFSFKTILQSLNSIYTYIVFAMILIFIFGRNIDFKTGFGKKQKKIKINEQIVKDFLLLLQKNKIRFPSYMTYSELKQHLDESVLDAEFRQELQQIVSLLEQQRFTRTSSEQDAMLLRELLQQKLKG